MPNLEASSSPILVADLRMTPTLYGIPNCDTVKKARVWLEARKIAYTFHDYKKAGAQADKLQRWCKDRHHLPQAARGRKIRPRCAEGHRADVRAAIHDPPPDRGACGRPSGRLRWAAVGRNLHADRLKGSVMETKDCHGAVLANGDSVTLIKDLKVKGSSVTLKRGTTIKGIRLTGDPGEIEGKSDKVKGLVLKTEFVKKAWHFGLHARRLAAIMASELLDATEA
jgi:protein PhnA